MILPFCFPNLFHWFFSVWLKKKTNFLFGPNRFFSQFANWKRNYNKFRCSIGLKNCLLTTYVKHYANSNLHQKNDSLLKNIPYFSTLFYSTDQFELRPNCPPGQKLVEKPEGDICMEDIRRNRYQIQRNGE